MNLVEVNSYFFEMAHFSFANACLSKISIFFLDKRGKIQIQLRKKKLLS